MYVACQGQGRIVLSNEHAACCVWQMPCSFKTPGEHSDAVVSSAVVICKPACQAAAVQVRCAPLTTLYEYMS